MTIGQNIKKLCEENNIKPCELAESIGITHATLSRYISGDREPKLQNICMIADYFGVSVDWLCGRSEFRNYNGFISGDDALEYCERAKKTAHKCWLKAVEYDLDITSSKLASNVIAMAFFEHERSMWGYVIPNMIHSLVDGSWKKDGEAE